MWIIIIGLALGFGVWLASRQTAKQVVNATSVNKDDDVSLANSDSTEATSANTNSGANSNTTNVANSATPAPEAPKVTVPALADIAYQTQSTSEESIMKTVKSFYQAYNTADQAGLIAQFDLSVSVTTAVQSALAPDRPRPYQVTIKRIDLRSDGSSVVYVSEMRSDKSTHNTEIELFPANSGNLLVAYRADNNASSLSGFDN